MARQKKAQPQQEDRKPQGDNPHKPIFNPPADERTRFKVSNDPYSNGMKDAVEGGFVTLEEAERVRAQAIKTGNPKLAEWANAMLPHKFAIKDATVDEVLRLGPADIFSNQCNQGFAHAFWAPFPGTDLTTWCPQAFVATKPDPNNNPQNKAYLQGPTLVGYASFSERIGVNDVAAIFDNALASAKESYGIS